MRSSLEMYDFCLKNNCNYGFTKNKFIKYFDIIAKRLYPNEFVIASFVGLHNYSSFTKWSTLHAYAVTNRRLLFSRTGLVKDFFDSVSLDRLNSISFTQNFAVGIFAVDSFDDNFKFAIEKSCSDKINLLIQDLLTTFQNGDCLNLSPSTPKVITTPSPSNSISTYVTGLSHDNNRKRLKTIINTLKIEGVFSEYYCDLKDNELIDKLESCDKVYELAKEPLDVSLVPEPTNPYDKNAIRVFANDYYNNLIPIGYIPKTRCKEVFRNRSKFKNEVVSATISGGKYKELAGDGKVHISSTPYFIDLFIKYI